MLGPAMGARRVGRRAAAAQAGQGNRARWTGRPQGGRRWRTG